MRKILFLLFLVKFAYGQEPAYNYMRNNYSIRGVRVDSLFLFPKYSDTTATHIVGSVIMIGNKFYFRDTTKWVAFGQSGIDTTSLSNRINSKADTSLLIGVLYESDTILLLATKSQITSLQNALNTKIDSLKKSSDSVYFKKNGVWYFVYKDSVGTFDSTSLSNRINQKLNISDTSAMLSRYLRKIDTASLSNRINLKVNISDTSAMLSRYLRKIDTASLSNRINLKVNISDTNSMLSPYLRKSDTSSLSNRINLKVNISDTGSMLSPYLRKVDTASLSSRINLKLNISDTSSMLNTYLRKIDTASLSNRINNKVDSLYRNSTNVYYVKNGVSTLAYTDSVGMAQNGRFGSDTATILMAKVHNDAGVQLTNGKVVYLSSSGTSSDVPSVKLANNKGDSSSANTFGFVSGTIAVNDTGWVILSGKIEKLNTSAFSNGDIIYLDSISGQWTKTKPSAPYHMVYLGVVIKANAGNGSIFVKCQNGYELDEIHDVKISGKLNNQVLVYSDTQKVWKNRSVYSVVDTTQLSARIDQRVKYSDSSTIYQTKYRTDTMRTNVYNALNGKQGTLTLTTTGSSGAATLTGNTLNIPQYSGGGGATSAGAQGDVQYKSGSGFGASSNLHWDTTNARLGIGLNYPVGKLSIDRNNNDYTNDDGEGSHISMTNPNTNGQNVVTSIIDGQIRAKWRTDYVGNVNWIANGGGHYFYTGGDFPNGSSKLIIADDGNVGVGTDAPQNKLDVLIGGASNMDRGYYEAASFTTEGDTKVGIYSNGTEGQGASLTFGNIQMADGDDYYLGMEMQYIPNYDAFSDNSYKINSLKRQANGQVVAAAVNLLEVKADGAVRIAPTGYSVDVNPSLYVNGLTTTKGQRLGFKYTDDNYNVEYTDHYILVEATSDITMTLPVAVAGQTYIFKKLNEDYSITISPQSGSTIDGNSDYTLTDQYKYVTLIADDGGNWWIIANN